MKRETLTVSEFLGERVFRIGYWELHRSPYGSKWVHDTDYREPEKLASKQVVANAVRWAKERRARQP